MGTIRVKLRYMYASLLTCIILLTSVNVELLIRAILEIFRPDLVPPHPQVSSLNSSGAS